MFERAMTDFPELEPTALSRPSSSGLDDHPWVVQFENLVTPAQAVKRRGSKRHAAGAVATMLSLHGIDSHRSRRR